MSPDNALRSQSESLYTLIKLNHPDSLSLLLTSTLTATTSPDLRSMSALLLRKLVMDECVLSGIGSETKQTLKKGLLEAMLREESRSILKKIGDVVVELAGVELPEGTWGELMPFLYNCVVSGGARLKEAGLVVFGQLAGYIGESMVGELGMMREVLGRCLGSGEGNEVRIAALGAVVNLVECLGSGEERGRFEDLVPGMVGTLTEALNAGMEAMAQEALELLIDLAGTEPRFLRRRIVDVVGAILQIAEAEHLEEGTRHLAIEFVITLAEARERAPGMMRKMPQFVHRLFVILMKMLCDIEDEPDWHGAETEDEDAGETTNYSESLDRLAISLGGNTIVPVASEVLPAYLAAPEWQKRHAAMICLAQIAEGCVKVMTNNLEQVVSMVLNSFHDPHPRVRWAAINVIRKLSMDLGPDLQMQFLSSVLPVLASAMDDYQNPRVQAHAASAVLNFSENCTPEILSPYLDGIVTKLLVLLQNGKQMVQEGALTALASVADSSQEVFQKYYSTVMPYLIAILMNATDKSHRMLRAKAMECISLVGMAVGKEKFKDDARQVMEVLMKLQGSQLEADDPTISYMLKSAQLKPDVTITSADSDVDIDDSDDESIETITLGDKRIGIKTSVLEEKATACNMLCCYADELKEGFFPWVDQVATILVPLLKFYFHEEVRKASVSAMPELLRSSKLAIEKGLAQGRSESYLKQLMDYIVPALVGALHKEPEVGICSNMLDALNECIQEIVDEIKQVITASSSRKKDREERTKAEDFDAEEGELLKEENEEEEELFYQAAVYGLGVCAEYGRSVFRPLVGEALSRLSTVIGHPNARHPDNIMAYDHAVSALGKICQHHRESINAAQIVPLWLNCLPIKGLIRKFLDRPSIFAQNSSSICRGLMRRERPSNRANRSSNDQLIEATSANSPTFCLRVNIVFSTTTAAARSADNSFFVNFSIRWSCSYIIYSYKAVLPS
ncbi:Importin-5-like protein [Drosera capensis]